jgi:hypothetical protein
MLENQLTGEIINRESYKTEIARNYTLFLSKYPEIFSDLVEGSIFDFAIYDSLESYDDESPIEVFNVLRNNKGIEIKPGKAEESDLELSLSVRAIEKLIQTFDKNQYAQLLGTFFNEPDEEKGWIDLTMHKRTQILIEMGYGKFAQTAGILEEYDAT